MFDLLSRNWSMVALRGVCALLLGLATIAWPGATLATLVLFFGIYAIADGLLALAVLFEPALTADRRTLVFHSLVSILAGVLAVVQPGITALVFVYLIAAWAILTGGSTIVAAIELRKTIDSEWLLGLSGGAATAVVGLTFHTLWIVVEAIAALSMINAPALAAGKRHAAQ